MQFLADVLLLGGTNRTVKITVRSDGDPSPGISDVLIVQVCPPIPATVNVAIVPTDGTAVTANLTEAQEVAGVALKCVLRDAQWLRELDWALVDPLPVGAPEIGGLLYLRNEGPNAAVYLIGAPENGPALTPPRPNPIQVTETTAPLLFLADALLLGGTNRTVKITVQSDGDPSPGISDTLKVQVCPPIPGDVIVAIDRKSVV